MASSSGIYGRPRPESTRSLSTRPSRSTTTRAACAAMSGSWVTMMTVWPAAWSDAEDLHDLLAGDAVEVAGRLVGQEDAGLVHQRTGDGHPLALAAGELVGPVVHAVGQAHPLQRRRGPVAALPPAHAGVHQRQLHVVQRGGPGQQVEGLEHEADLAVPYPGERVVAEPRDFLAVEPVLARRWAYRGSRAGSSSWTCRSPTGP